MTKDKFIELCKAGPVYLDGATGTNLMKAGMPIGVCPEKWVQENEDVMLSLQRDYVAAGTNILYAPTFTANRIKLEEYGLEDELVEINRAMVRISKLAAAGKALVAGDLTMTGKQVYPIGDLMFEDLVEVYKEQVRAILLEEPDLFVVETMMSLQETRAAVLAIKETCDLPVMATLTYNEDGRTLFGTNPETAVVALQSLGVDAVGCNCSSGPDQMLELIQRMKKYARVPLIAKPNAGLPELINGETVYGMTPDEFAHQVKNLMDAGASIVGGCCGTTTEHIRALVDLTGDMSIQIPNSDKSRVLTSERKFVEIDPNGPFLVIGERINPTGKKALQAELREGKLEMVSTFAVQQEEQGASILDVNMGTNGIDEKEMMLKAIYEVTSTVDLPLCIDSSYVEVIEAALRIYPGRALINSISGEEEKLQKLLPIARKYGAMFILLPLTDSGLPKDAEEKKQNIEMVLSRAEEVGLKREDAVVDLLVATVGADASAARNCFDTVTYCKERNMPTVCGLSNISFGLPQRIFVNTAFFTIALSKGLTMAIANPSQEVLMYSAMAADMLMERPGATERYLDRVPAGNLSIQSSNNNKDKKGDKGDTPGMHPVMECVVKGNKDRICEECKALVSAGESPSNIVDQYLIPGINEVGRLYDEKKYFLPQLISGANAMKAAMEYIEPLMEANRGDEKETIVIATVEGDIHDIGKNLVALMLKNYGYRVLDLGKDVPAETIVSTAIQEKASCIGLSALMTTTMMRMQDVVELAKERGCTAKVFIGGACITPSFAEEIGADAYAEDAADSVRVVERLLAFT